MWTISVVEANGSQSVPNLLTLKKFVNSLASLKREMDSCRSGVEKPPGLFVKEGEGTKRGKARSAAKRSVEQASPGQAALGIRYVEQGVGVPSQLEGSLPRQAMAADEVRGVALRCGHGQIPRWAHPNMRAGANCERCPTGRPDIKGGTACIALGISYAEVAADDGQRIAEDA